MGLEHRLDAFFAKWRFEYFGLAGCGIIAIACLITAVGYTGLAGDSYSILNHYISDLGVYAESQLAWVFNIGLLVGTPLIATYFLGTRAIVPSKIGGIGRVAGLITSVGGFLVGIFPADVYIFGHNLAAGTFFFGGALTVGLLSLAILMDKQSRLPKWLSVLGAAIMVCFALFLIAAQGRGVFLTQEEYLNQLSDIPPQFDLVPFLEWLPLLGILIWVSLVAIYALKSRLPLNKSPSPA